MAKRNIEIWFNITTRKLQDEAGYNLVSTDYEGATFGEKPMLHLQLVTDSNNTAYTNLSNLDAYSASIDTDYDPVTDLLTKTFNADINQAGEWKAGGTALASLGQFSIPLDMDKTAITTKLGKLAKLANSKFELKCLEVGSGDFTFRVLFPFNVYNLQDNGAAVSPAPASDYYTKTEVDAIVALYQTLGNIELIVIDFTIVQQNTIFTVPSGKLFKPEFGDILTTALTGTIAALKYKWLAGSTELFPDYDTAMSAIGNFDGVELNPVKYWPAGTVFKVEITQASTATAHTGQAIIKGILIDA